MGIKLECLAEALKVSREITEEDEVLATKIWEENKNYYCNRNEVYEEVLARKIVQRIQELVEKVEG